MKIPGNDGVHFVEKIKYIDCFEYDLQIEPVLFYVGAATLQNSI
jgi:hypothetical protein